jgi:hypothetical protein
MKEKKYLTFFILLVLCFLCTKARAQFDLSLSPILVQIDLVPGAKKHFSLELFNENKTDSIKVIAYTMDIIETKEGIYELQDKGKSQFSCADWMRIEDTSFTLKPSDSKELKVSITAPRDLFGGRYGAVVFEIVPEESPTGAEELGRVRYHFRMPAFVEVTIKRFGGLVRKATISDFKVETVSTRKFEKKMGKEALGFTASIKNNGNIHLIGKGTLFIKDKEGRTKRRVPLGGGRGIVIPEATVAFRSLLKKPPAGEYTAKAVIHLGGLSPLIAEIPFTVSRTKSTALGSFKVSSYIALDIKPEQLEIKIPPRGFRTATFSFRNNESDSIEVKAHLKDIEYDEEGNLIILDNSVTGRSCREWISLDPQEFTIAAEGRKHVKLNLQAPAQGDGGYYACVVFDVLLKSSEKDAISTPFQIPVILSVPQNVEKKGKVVDLQIKTFPGMPSQFTAYFKNTGNIHLKPKGRVSFGVLREITNSGDIVYVGEPKYEKVGEFFFQEVEQYVLPGGTREMLGGCPKPLEAGKYLAVVTIDYGGSEPLIFKKEFNIK